MPFYTVLNILRWVLIVTILIGVILWVFRLCLERFRTNQRRYNEDHVLLYPLATVRLDLNASTAKNVAPIAVEPCNDYRTGIVTVAVKMPTGRKQFTPKGSSGLMVASSYCLLTPFHLALLQASDIEASKNEKKVNKNSWLRCSSSLSFFYQ